MIIVIAVLVGEPSVIFNNAKYLSEKCVSGLRFSKPGAGFECLNQLIDDYSDRF